jgi:hypothetical protein
VKCSRAALLCRSALGSALTRHRTTVSTAMIRIVAEEQSLG